MSHLYLRIGLGFSVGVDHFIMKHWGFSATHWTFQYRDMRWNVQMPMQ